MHRRAEPRTRKRIACELLIDGSRHSGIVLDVSRRGMYVQTTAQPRPGARVLLTLKLPGTDSELGMQAKVARKKVVPPQLTAVAQGGIGLRLVSPPAAYTAIVEAVEAGRPLAELGEIEIGEVELPLHTHATPLPSAAAPRKPGGRGRPGKPGKGTAGRRSRYRVNVARADGTEPNTYTIGAFSEEAAAEKVEQELGEGWAVISIERA